MAVANKRFTVKQLKEQLAKMKSERAVWEDHWQDILDFIFPRRGDIITKRTPGHKKTLLLDSTGVHSNELLAGMLHGLLTNPDTFWFEFTTGSVLLDNNDNVRKYLQYLQREIHNVLNNSNFQTEAAELYLDLPSVGTACQLIEQDDKDFVRFATYFVGSFFIGEDRFGRVNKIFKEWKWDIAEVVNFFGKETMPPRILKMFQDGKDEKICVVQAIYPKYLLPNNSGGLNFISQYILPDFDHEVSIGGYMELPYVVPRWGKASGECYGRSPGMNALPEVKVLNKMSETMLIGAQKVVDPPVQLPDDGFLLPLITKPGGINFYRAGTQDVIRPVFNDTRIDFGYQAMEDRRKRIRDAFFVDQLKLQQGGPMMTATEVLQRTEESTRLLGPVLGRMQSEYLRPMIERVFRILTERGRLERAPVELKGTKLDVRYSSLVAKSQRISDGQSVTRTIQAIAPFIEMDNSVADNFSGDNAVRILASVYGAPQEILRDAKEVDAIRKSREEAAKQQAEMQAEMQQAEVTSLNMDSIRKA